MTKFFSLDELSKNLQSDLLFKSDLLIHRFLDSHEEKIENIKKLSSDLPKKDEIYFLWTENSFNAFTFIPYIIKQCGKIDHLVISTYSINQRIVNSFIRYFEKGLIKKAELLISESLLYRLPIAVDLLNSLIESEKFDIKVNYSWNHSKISLIKSEDNYFVVEGSGNWSENSKFEQYIFLNSEKIFNFRKKCINDAIR